MAFAPGLFTACIGDRYDQNSNEWLGTCGSTDLELVRESFDEQDRVFVGEQRCRRCGCAMLYARRPTTAEKAVMAKKKQPAKKKASSGSKAKASKPKSRRPRSQPLPGMEDARIKPLDDVAAAYADIRDQRIALNKDEHELKQTTIKLMKKYDKMIYKHDGIEIRIVSGEEDVKVKVKVKAASSQDEDETDETPVEIAGPAPVEEKEIPF